MKNSKKLIIALLLLLTINVGLFARTTYVHSSYYDGASPLFNDIYSSLMLNSSYLNPIFESETEDIIKLGVNTNGSVFFKDVPVGMYYSMDLIPLKEEVFIADVVFGLAIRQQMNDLTESYVNLGPALSIVANIDDDVSATPYTLIYWGGAVNAGYRFAPSQQLKSITFDVGATAKAFWYDSESSDQALLLNVRDFRYAFSAYVGFTYRWFAPNLNEDDINVIVNL